MNFETILNDIKTLPPDKQEEVADFIAFIKIRSGIRKDKALTPAKSFPKNSGGFIGMWADRSEMSDSAYWVGELRTREWEKRNV